MNSKFSIEKEKKEFYKNKLHEINKELKIK